MIMRYHYLSQHEKIFQQMTGLRVKEFDQLFQDVLSVFVEAEEKRLVRAERQRAIGGGRQAELGARDQILLTIVWLRHYPTQPVLGYLFGVSQAVVSNYVAHVLPVLEQVGRDTMRMPDPGKKRRRNLDQLLKAMPELVVLIDSFGPDTGVQQRVQRPQGKEAQKPYYSGKPGSDTSDFQITPPGKKKAHTLKSQISVNEDTGQIVDVSDSVPGSMADITLLDQSGLLSRLPQGIGGAGDLGYKGIHKRHPLGCCPRKKPRGKDRPPEDVVYNTAFSRRRIVVENSIGRMRRYQSITQPDRHHRHHHTARVVAVAGLANRQITSHFVQ